MALNWSSQWMRVQDLLENSRDLARGLAWRLEHRSPNLGRKLLKAALTASSSLGTTVGLEIREINDSKVVLHLNQGWPDLAAGEVSIAALLNASEMAARFFWERQLVVGQSRMRVLEARVKIIETLEGPATVLYAVSPVDRETWMSQLRASGEVQCETSAQIFDMDNKLVATCDLSWRLVRQLQLESRI